MLRVWPFLLFLCSICQNEVIIKTVNHLLNGGNDMDKRKIIITQNIDSQYYQQIHCIVPAWELIVGKDKDVWKDHIHDAEIIAGWKKGMEELFLKEELDY